MAAEGAGGRRDFKKFENFQPIKARTQNVNAFYGEKQALFDVSLDIPDRTVTALIGPSGCGKTTFLKLINRLFEKTDGTRMEGVVHVDGQDIYGPTVDPVEVRKRVGMVFQKANPFPKSIYDNVAFGPRIHNLIQGNGFRKRKAHLDETVEKSLVRAGLWEEVKDRLHQGGQKLSGGQEQRLVIARTIAVNPDIILMDE